MLSNKFQDLLSAVKQGVIRVTPEPELELEPDPGLARETDSGNTQLMR